MKKKIIIFSSTGGGGHVSAAKAITEYLQNNYEVKVVYPFLDIFDLLYIRKLTESRYNIERIYNFIARKHIFSVLNAIYYIGRYFLKLRKKSLENHFKAYLEKEQPALIISVMPAVNRIILDVTQKLEIPFLVVPTDLDPRTFIWDLRKPDYEKFHMGIAFDLPEIIKNLESAQIGPEFYSVIGFPIRPNFFKTFNANHVKKEFNIPENKSVILFMIGSVGSASSMAFLMEMKKIESPCHIIVCLGKSEHLKEKIEKIALPSHISITTLGFTQKIPELMTIANLFVTKSGSVSVCEALYMNLPMLIDGTGTILAWEKFNLTLIKENGFGAIVHSKSKISQKIDYFLKNPQELAKCRENMKKFPKKPFGKNLPILVRYMTSGKFSKKVLEFIYDFL